MRKDVGRMINQEINAIKDRIRVTIRPKRIYLFGSLPKIPIMKIVIMIFILLFRMTQGISLSCLRKHINHSEAFEDAR